jgi:hypothetical protein
MERPTNKESFKQLTPILEDYSLRVVLDETWGEPSWTLNKEDYRALLSGF